MTFEKWDKEQILADALKIERQTNAYLRQKMKELEARNENLTRTIGYYRNLLDINKTRQVKMKAN